MAEPEVLRPSRLKSWHQLLERLASKLPRGSSCHGRARRISLLSGIQRALQLYVSISVGTSVSACGGLVGALAPSLPDVPHGGVVLL